LGEVESTPDHMTPTQPSVVTAVKRVSIELKTLSKLSGLLIHSPPLSKHSHLVRMPSLSYSGTFCI
jgi:hypothetical protein